MLAGFRCPPSAFLDLRGPTFRRKLVVSPWMIAGGSDLIIVSSNRASSPEGLYRKPDLGMTLAESKVVLTAP